MGTGYYVDHDALTQARTAIEDATVTLNTTLKNLMTEIDDLMPTWVGLGATAFSGYMAQYHSDAAQMSAALAVLGQKVDAANKGYAGQDQAAQAAWQHTH